MDILKNKEIDCSYLNKNQINIEDIPALMYIKHKANLE